MQTLTIKKAKAAARKAYREKRLTAQHPKATKRQCVYSSGKYACAVGAGLNEVTLDAIAKANRNASRVSTIMHSPCMAASDDDFCAITRLQSLHDNWCNYSRDYGAKNADTIEARQKFLEFIGL